VIRKEEILKEGWLMKQSKFLKNWKRRWFVLTPTYICSFQQQGVYHKPTEVLRLRECSTVKSADDNVDRENAFRVETPSRVFFLIAETNVEKESWIGHIGRQMVRPTVMKEYNDDD